MKSLICSCVRINGVGGVQVAWAGEQGHLCIYLRSLITCASLMEGEEDGSAGGDSHSKFKPST